MRKKACRTNVPHAFGIENILPIPFCVPINYNQKRYDKLELFNFFANIHL